MKPILSLLALLASAASLPSCSGEVTPDPAAPVRPRDQKSGCYADTKGAEMVRFAMPDGRGVCMDKRVATQAEFSAFATDARAAGKMAGPPADHPMGATCAKYVDPVVPTSKGDQFPTCGKLFDPVAHPDSPMLCMDWCAAYAFCSWSGKRLCGNNGAAIAPDDTTPREGSEYAFACSSGGKNTFQVDPQVRPECAYGTSDKLSFPGADCVGDTPPFDQISGLTGPTRTVVDECLLVKETAQGMDVTSPYCGVYGGASSSGPLPCSAPRTVPRRIQAEVGVRCCSD